MCRIRERTLENQLRINEAEIEAFEQRLLSFYSRLHKMKSTQAELQVQLFAESRERLTEVVKPRGKKKEKTPKVLTIAEGLKRVGWSQKAITDALTANPGWKTKEIRI